MINHKIFDTLKSFDENYLKRLRDFTNSPYFNSNKKVKELFEIIYSAKPEFTGKKLEKKNLIAKFFPVKEKNSEQLLKNLFSELSGLVKDFLVHNGLQRNEYVRENLYLDELFYLSKFSDGVKQSNNLIAKYKGDQLFSPHYFDSYSKAISNLSRCLYMEGRSFETEGLSEKSYEIFILKFIYDFIDLKNSVALYDKSGNAIEIPEFITKFQNSFNLAEIVESLKKYNRNYAGILDAYSDMDEMLGREDNSEIFLKLKQKVFANIDKVSYEEKYFLYTVLTNNVYSNLGAAKPEYYKDAFEIVKFFLEKEVFLYPGSPYMLTLNYENIASCSSFMEDNVWTENFLIEYKKFLNPELRDMIFNKSMASFKLGIREFDDALKYINCYKAGDVYEKVYVKFYIIIIFYEKGDLERSLYELDTLLHYVNYNDDKLPKNLEAVLRNTVPALKKVITTKANYKKIDYADFKAFQETPNIYFKNWIIKKMEELL
ncbi:MAG: hypothetical protein JSS63_09455 [Bacteroidetes bacterium]|nr:hypothetical protein [Bacteroidota bacterium]